MITAFILLIVAVSMFAAIILTRQWVLERRGIDLDDNRLELQDVESFTSQQKLVLGLLFAPGALFLVVTVVYVLAGLAVTAVGA
jgi:hypothetical protein